ncbi:hypothetical protein U1Q18_051609, partial [Sarracenia purpurea var. burkii]
FEGGALPSEHPVFESNYDVELDERIPFHRDKVILFVRSNEVLADIFEKRQYDIEETTSIVKTSTHLG